MINMLDKSYVLVVENDVFYKMSFSSTLPIGDRWTAGLSSSPQFVEATFYSEVCVGATWVNNNFYLPEDTEKLNPLLPANEEGQLVKFAAIVDEDVFGIVSFPDDFSPELVAPLRAAFLSSPIVIECENNNPVQVGWTWDGSTFIPPA
jgi:hypothetical protein